MDITPASLQILFNAFDMSYQSGLSSPQEVWTEKLAMTRPSSTSQNTYPFMGLAPQLREWVGERQVQSVTAYKYVIANKHYESTVEVDKNDIEDDQYGLYAPIIVEMGVSARKWPDTVTIPLLQAGQTTLCYDNQNFFDTQHPIDMLTPSKGVQSNLFTSQALTPEHYQEVRVAMMSLIGENSLPLGVRPNLLIVPPQLEATARQILHADYIVAQTGTAPMIGGTNVFKGTADLLVVDMLANQPTEWYLADTTRTVKPLVWQLRQAPRFVQLIDPQSPNVFNLKKFLYGTDARGAAGFGLWQFMAKGVA